MQLVARLIGAKFRTFEPTLLLLVFEARKAASPADKEKGNLRALFELLDGLPDRLCVVDPAKIARVSHDEFALEAPVFSERVLIF